MNLWFLTPWIVSNSFGTVRPLFFLALFQLLTNGHIELGDICSAQYTTSELIDQALRTYLHFTAKYKDEYLPSSEGVDCCIHKLLDSALYIANKDYVRTQLVYSLLQDDEAASLYIIASFLLCDGLQNEETFEMMNVEGAFPRLVDLIKSKRDEDHRLHRRLLELLYEMSRLQRLSAEDLAHVDDGFIGLQFQNIEQLSDDSDDPYHYPVIRVLVGYPAETSESMLTKLSWYLMSSTWLLRRLHLIRPYIRRQQIVS